jgi:hypothetical protein
MMECRLDHPVGSEFGTCSCFGAHTCILRNPIRDIIEFINGGRFCYPTRLVYCFAQAINTLPTGQVQIGDEVYKIVDFDAARNSIYLNKPIPTELLEAIQNRNGATFT